MLPTWIIVSACAAVVAVVSDSANRRRVKRSDINKVGFMPWPFITAMALLCVGISIAFGLGFLSTN